MEAERFVMHLHGGLSRLENKIRNFRDLKHTSVMMWPVLWYTPVHLILIPPCIRGSVAAGENVPCNRRSLGAVHFHRP